MRYLIASAAMLAGLLMIAEYFISHDRRPKPLAVMALLALPFLLAIVSPLRVRYLERVLIVSAILIPFYALLLLL